MPCWDGSDELSSIYSRFLEVDELASQVQEVLRSWNRSPNPWKRRQSILSLLYYSRSRLYPAFQEYFRTYEPPFLAVWGKDDPFFLPTGAEAFKRDIPNAVVRLFDTGHFALETHASEIAAAIREFLTS